MRRPVMAVRLCLLCLVAFSCAEAQQSPPGSTPNPDYSREPVVYEEASTHITLAKDGTSEVESMAHVRVQSPAGLKAYGLLRFPYESGTSTLDIEWVRVRKPDGKVVETPRENALEMPSEITRLAPYYSDLKEKQVAVRGLDVGDTLEYQYRVLVHSPIDPGHYWAAYGFTKQAVVLKEELEFSAPRDRYVQVKSRSVQPVITESGGNRVYTWKTANLEPKKADPASGAQTTKAQEPPDVLITTFHSWGEVGDWFRGLAGPRAQPTAEVRAKAAALVQGAGDDAQKIGSLYKYVSTGIRYIGVALGIGRYQPHAAAEVLANEYGDCKDKHTLLASLLSVEGLKAGAALINSTQKIDAEVPSPGQFDHMVTTLPDGQSIQWMDTTEEVAPLGYLAPALRDKQALLIPASGEAQLVTTPADPPFLSVLDFQMDATLDDKGTLTGTAKFTLRGDLEFILRTAYRQAGESQWNEFTQKISASLGFGGTVSEVQVDPPEATESAFHIRYQYTRKEFGNWASRQIPAAIPPLPMPEAPPETEKNPQALELGTPVEYDMRSAIKLPAGLTPQVPHPLSNVQDFADYSTKSSFSGGIYQVERHLAQKARRVQPAEFETYRKFVKQLYEDWVSMVPLTAEAATAPTTSDNPDAADAYEKGTDAARSGEMEEAIRWYRAAVQKDPQFGAAWFDLAVAHYSLGVLTDAADEMSHAILLEHSLAGRGKMMARNMQGSGRFPEALKVWKAVAKADPDDADAARAVGGILISQKRYAEAVPELEGAVTRNPKNAQLQLLLAQALLPEGKKEEGAAALRRAVELDSSPVMMNDASFVLAEDGSHLEQAKEWAYKAVASADGSSFGISAGKLSVQDFNLMNALVAFWDTLGWVYFRMGDFENARKYLRAAWELGEVGDVGDHLGQALEKLGRPKEAAKIYAQAIAARGAPERSRERLIALLGGRARADSAIQKALDELSELRSVQLPLVSRDTSSADFYVVFQNGGEDKEVRFIEGAEGLRGATKALQEVAFEFPFPDGSPVKIVRRGVLGCEHEPASCKFVMISPADASRQPVPPRQAAPQLSPAPKPPATPPADAAEPPHAAPAKSVGAWTSIALPFAPFQVSRRQGQIWVCGTDEGIAASSDGGKTWEVKHNRKDGEVLLHVAALSETLVYAAGTHGLLLWSKDGGETWASRSNGSETIKRISFADETHGIRQAETRVEITTDGGAHWTEVTVWKTDKTVQPFSEVLGVAALDSLHMVIAVHQPQGENGFLATHDGGATWNLAHLADTFDRMLFVRDGEFWSYGTEYVNREVRGGYGVGDAVHSKDGETWTHAPHSPHEFTECTAQGCYLWDGALVDLSGEEPRFWSVPQGGTLSADWAIANGVLCSVNAKLKCAPAVAGAEPPARPEEDRPIVVSLNSRALSNDCLKCEFKSWAADKNLRINALVEAEIFIGKNGTVENVRVSDPPNSQIREAIAGQISNFIFVPPRREGRPAEMRIHARLAVRCSSFPSNEQGTCNVANGGQPVSIHN